MNLYIDYFHFVCYYVEAKLRFIFKDEDLLLLYKEEKNAHRYPLGVVTAFFDIMAIIASATSEADIRAFKSLRFEKGVL